MKNKKIIYFLTLNFFVKLLAPVYGPGGWKELVETYNNTMLYATNAMQNTHFQKALEALNFAEQIITKLKGATTEISQAETFAFFKKENWFAFDPTIKRPQSNPSAIDYYYVICFTAALNIKVMQIIDLRHAISSLQKKVNDKLIEAIANDNIKLVEEALNHGANIEDNDLYDWALNRAVFNNHIEILDFLLKQKSKINIPEIVKYALVGNNNAIILKTFLKYFNKSDINGKELGRSLLSWCIFFDDFNQKETIKKIEMLLKHGANINLQDDVTLETPLMVAVSKNSVELIKLLIDNNADVNMQNNDGNTALILTALQPYINLEIIQLLLENCAAMEMVNNNKLAFIDYIKKQEIRKTILSNYKKFKDTLKNEFEGTKEKPAILIKDLNKIIFDYLSLN